MIQSQLRVLQVTGTLNPKYGGPTVAVNQLTQSLQEMGHSVDVVTLDRPGEPWLANTHDHIFALKGIGKYRYSRRLRAWLLENGPDYDAMIVHGIWQYQSVATRLACNKLHVPYFLFIHGALNPWFKSHYPAKHLKKLLYWRLFEYRALRDAEAVVFTCEEERRQGRESFTPYKATEVIVAIGLSDVSGDPAIQREAFLSDHPNLRGKRVVLFLGRLHPVKGCDLLIRAFAAASRQDEDLRLVIAGPDENGTKSSLTALSESLGVQAKITWTGMLSGQTKWGAFRSADVFALMSHSESFGMAIVEALACGVPVLITDKVNIWHEIDNCGAGLVGPDTQEGAAMLLQRWLELPEGPRAAIRLRARECFTESFEAHRTTARLVDLLSAAAPNREPHADK